MFSSYPSNRTFARSFQLLRQAFLQAEGLPFSEVLSEDDIEQAFEAENACFAQNEGDIYTPAITLWAFLSQTLHAQRLRSCAAAVSRVIVLCVTLGRQPPAPDTGAYCRARKVARTRADAAGLWRGRSTGVARARGLALVWASREGR